MTKKPLCKCGHRATEHTSVFFTPKKNNPEQTIKHYTKCRIKDCDCKAYEATIIVEEKKECVTP